MIHLNTTFIALNVKGGTLLKRFYGILDDFKSLHLKFKEYMYILSIWKYCMHLIMFYKDHMLDKCRALNMLSSLNKDAIIIMLLLLSGPRVKFVDC